MRLVLIVVLGVGIPVAVRKLEPGSVTGTITPGAWGNVSAFPTRSRYEPNPERLAMSAANVNVTVLAVAS